MSFAVVVHSLTILPHGNADALELAQVGEYLAVVRKGQFQTGDLAAYLPEASLLPEALIDELGLAGRLSGPLKNRVKAVRLRGVTSQGLVYPARDGWAHGQDVQAELGVTKYEPPVPGSLQGTVWIPPHCAHAVGTGYLATYDIENFKGHANVLRDGEDVVMTEKIHGTFCQIVALRDGSKLIASKGLGGKGFAFTPDTDNAYTRAEAAADVANRARPLTPPSAEAVAVYGEVFGPGVQDLHYGAGGLRFRCFDVRVIGPGSRFMDDAELDAFCTAAGIDRVPVLYRGPYSRDVLKVHTDGKTVAGDGAHIREGVVVRPCVERRHLDDLGRARLPLDGRVQLKSVSDAYLFRGGEQTDFV